MRWREHEAEAELVDRARDLLGASSSVKPSASSTSAEPEDDETARLPCFATAAPAAAATSAAAVEMLSVCAPSPPVPAVSTRSTRSGRTRTTCARIASREARDLVRSLALEPKRDQEAADLRGRRIAAHDAVHHLAGLLAGEIDAVEQPLGSPGSRGLQEVPRESRVRWA